MALVFSVSRGTSLVGVVHCLLARAQEREMKLERAREKEIERERESLACTWSNNGASIGFRVYWRF